MMHIPEYNFDEFHSEIEKLRRFQMEQKEQTLVEIITKYDFIVGSKEVKFKLMEILPEGATIISSPYIESPNLIYAIKKFDATDLLTQEQDIIKVGDEVFSEMNDLRFIVTRIITSKHMDITVKRYEGICTDGACYGNLPEDIVKTGRTFPQIAEVLEEMRGEK